MRRPPRILFGLVLLATLAGAGLAQMMSFPYYGKNKINYERFPWKKYPTEHFAVYFYNDDAAYLKNIVNMAESAYKTVSQDLKHHLSEPVPLIVYTTYTDFEQSNVFQVEEGILGESEPVLFRIGVHGDMPLNELQDTLTHELGHIFQFDMLWGNQGGALTAVSQPPLWVFEGLSEFVTHHWSPWSTLIVRDTVLNDRIPDFDPSGDLVPRSPLPRDPAYDFGHAVYEFLVEKYGPAAIHDLWLGLKQGSGLGGRRDPFLKTFKIGTREFSQEFKKYLRARFAAYLTRESPEDYSVPLGPEFPINPYYFAFSHALSPSGQLVATLTFNARDGEMNIVLLSAKDGRILKSLTPRYSSDYESIKYEIDPSLGASLAWSPDGDRIVFFARDGRRHALYVVSAFDGDTVKKIKLDVDQPIAPCFLPDGRSLLFSGFVRGIHDLFSVDLDKGQVRNLTNDTLFEKAPAISPDGRSLVYSIRIGEEDKLFLSPLSDLKNKTLLTPGPGSAVCPGFSKDGRTLFFSGDARGAFNIYSLSLDSGDIRRHTDVRTGNYFPAPLPSEPNKVIFCSFNKGCFQLFKADAVGPVETTVRFVPAGAERPIESFRPLLSLDVQPDKIETQKGLGKLVLASRPPIQAAIFSDGSVFGGSALGFSDILGNHQFSISAYQVRDLRSYVLNYYNLASRLQYGLSVFQYSIYYYPNLYYYDPALAARATYADAIAVRSISGASLSFYYPLDRFVRLEGSLGFFRYEEDFSDPYMLNSYGYQGGFGFLSGTMASAGVSLVGETTRFKGYGPASGSTYRLAVTQGLPLNSSMLRNTQFEADVRKYIYLGADSLLALRWQGAACLGRNQFLSYYGGNNQVRSAYFYSIVGTEYWFANAELRFPFVGTMDTLIGNLGPIRGVIFFDVTRARYGNYPAKFYRESAVSGATATTGYIESDAIGSLGAGLVLYFLGLPVHLDWATRLEWPSIAKPLQISRAGNYELKFWIGYDF